jgi:predicted DCC family thiol-disulfide oxidoreductase YuxK
MDPGKSTGECDSVEHPVLKTTTEMSVFFDGECPLCRHEIAWLRRKDVDQCIEFIDIADPDFDATVYGRSQAQLMAQMHGRLADGTWTIGVDTFYHLYRLLGLGWAVSWTRWPILRPLTDFAYRCFAKIRTRLPGRSAGSCRSQGTCDSSRACDVGSIKTATQPSD